MTENDMKLPEGKTCADCANYEDCKFLFQCRAENTVCDWSPSYFRQRTIGQVEVKGERVLQK